MDFSVINEIILAILLGITQGITEFLPVSSTAHIRLTAGLLLGQKDIGLMASNVLQFGTLIAIVQHFWKDLKSYYDRMREILFNPGKMDRFLEHFRIWWNYPTTEVLQNQPQIDTQLREIEAEKEFRTDTTIFQLILGSFPIIILGFLLYNFAETNRTFTDIAYFLLAGSALMWLAESMHNRTENFTKNRIITKGEVLLIGIFQVLAIFPGISRSGATVSGALFLGRRRDESVRFSFLLSIPALLLAGTKDFLSFISFTLKSVTSGGSSFLFPQRANWSGSLVNLSLVSLLVGTILSYFIGLACLKWLLKYLSQNSFRSFIVYRVILALTIFTLLWLDIIRQ